MIRWVYAFVDRPYERFGAARDFWARVTGSRLSELRGERGQFVTLLPTAGGADACVKLQGVADGPGGAHVDLVVDDVPCAARRARELGASGVFAEPGLEVLRSPAGHLFCLVPWEGESAVPGPVAAPAPSGALSRFDQVCVDTAPDAYDAEVDFWAALTGWPEVPCGGAEFRRLAGSPVQLLFQRLDTDDSPSAHPDFACEDVPSVRAWHESLGAEFVRRGTEWQVMRDPSGGLYCLTERSP